MRSNDHNLLVIEEFTKKAESFYQCLGRPSLDHVLEIMVEMSGVTVNDRVLDVCCGPGLVACRFATGARHVTGLDITPALLEHARKLQAERGLTNLSWDRGDAAHLPYPDGSFDIVLSRFAFHHCTDKMAVFREMVRVCSPGGSIILADLVVPVRKRVAFDRVERLKDPSHAGTMTRRDYLGLAGENGMSGIRSSPFRLEMDLEQQLGSVIRDPDSARSIRMAYCDDMQKNALGMDTRTEGSSILFSYPCLVMACRKSR